MVQPFGLPHPTNNGIVTPNNKGIVTHQNDPLNFPPGVRFCPSDCELIYYLKMKSMNYVLPHNEIQEVNLYKYSPDHLSGRYRKLEDKDLHYVFTHRDRKYKNGSRPNRAAGSGYWKATSADKAITHGALGVIGCKKTLVYHEGRPPKGEKTNWIMHEYTVKEATTPKPRGDNADPMRLDDWVLCRIYKKADKVGKSTKKEDENNIVEANTSPPPCSPRDEESEELAWAAQLVTDVPPCSPQDGENEELAWAAQLVTDVPSCPPKDGESEELAWAVHLVGEVPPCTPQDGKSVELAWAAQLVTKVPPCPPQDGKSEESIWVAQLTTEVPPCPPQDGKSEDSARVAELTTEVPSCPSQDGKSEEPALAAQLVNEVKFENNERSDENIQQVRFSFPPNETLTFQDGFKFENDPAYNDPQFINTNSFIPENIYNQPYQPFDFLIDHFIYSDFDDQI